MAQYRVLPSASAAPQITVNSRTYYASNGAQDVPPQDVNILLANNWTLGVLSGPTSARPTFAPDNPYNPKVGTHFLDETLGYIVIYDGAAWRNPATGAAV